MHAVAVEKEGPVTAENGSTKVAKKKSKNNRKQQGQKSGSTVSPPDEILDVKSMKKVNNCTNNGPVTVLEDSEFPRIEANGCAENHSHHDGENGELHDAGSKNKSRSKNQKKKHQKMLRNSIENGTDNNDTNSSSVCNDSDQLISNNNNIVEKFQSIHKNGSVANGTHNCPVASTEMNHVNDVKNIVPLSSSSPNSKTNSQSSSSSPSTDPSSSSVSSSSTQRLMISLDSSAASSSSPPPPAASSSHEQISNKTSEKLESKEDSKKGSESPEPVSPAAQPALGPIVGEDGAVGGVGRTDVVIEYKQYESELQMQDIMRLIQSELSEPYSIYTYRYFIYNWPKLCFLAAHGDEYVGAIVCKLDMHMDVKRGYIAMLAVKKEYRKLKIGTTLVEKAIEAMLIDDADEVVLETEMKNTPALRLYENLGFVRDKRLFRYYLNGVDALRLKLWFR